MREGGPPAPTPFGKYLLDREIARGGMARVWLARLRGHGGFEKRLVVKQILPHLADDPHFVALFVEEAKTLVRLSHPHIVPVYELGVVEGTWFLAMEHVEGATLAAMLAEGPLEPEAVAHLGAEIADALAYAHEEFSLVHRDVTPRNVIVERAGHARLLDFGIAARATPEGEAGPGAVYGTPGYVSPEQARGEALDARSDVFSLGCVLFEALSGRPAFDRSELDAVRRLTPDRIPALPDPREALRALDAIIRRCLAPDVGDRPKGAREVGRLLRAWLRTREAIDPGPALAERVARAAEAALAVPAEGADGRVRTPGTARVADRSLATSRLLEAIVTPPPEPDGAAGAPQPRPGAGLEAAAENAEPEAGPGTVRLDRPRAAAAAGPAGGEAATGPSSAPAPARSAVGTVLWTAVGAALAAALVWTAGYDPPWPDPARSDTDVDGTMWIEAEDGDVADGGPAAARGSGEAPADARDAAPVDAGAPDAGRPPGTRGPDAGARAARSATLRVTADGNASIALDGHALGHAPIHETAIPAGAHTLIADCVALGREGRASFRAAAGASVRARVRCASDPVSIAIVGAD